MTDLCGEPASIVDIDPPRGRSLLAWDGKRPLRAVAAPPSRPVEVFQPAAERPDEWHPAAVPPPNSLFFGDNKPVLARLLADGARGTVDLVYIDPPFDSGGRYRRRAQLRGPLPGAARLAGEQVHYADAWAGDEYLQFMYERLLLLRELLAPGGSLYLHLDAHRSHALKLMCDEVFGAEQFEREIVWRIGWVSGFKSRARNWIRNHDILLYYVKAGGAPYFDKEYIPYPPGYTRRGGRPPTGRGYPLEDTWNCSDVDRLDSIQIKSFSREKLDFPTQKNEALLARIIRASCPPGGLVLDCFCGSGTAPAVAQKLGRRWIACDAGPTAVQITARRLQRIVLDQLAAAPPPAALPPAPPPVLSFATYRLDAPAPAPAPVAPPRAVVRVRRVDGAPDRVRVDVVDYVSPAIAARLPAGPVVDDWRRLVDTLLIDPAYDGRVLRVALADVPARRTDLVRGVYELPAPPAPTRVAVKLVDVLGEEGVVVGEG